MTDSEAKKHNKRVQFYLHEVIEETKVGDLGAMMAYGFGAADVERLTDWLDIIEGAMLDKDWRRVEGVLAEYHEWLNK